MTTTSTEGSYRAALRVREFRVLAAAALVSVLGDSAAYLAVSVLVYQQTGSPLLSALTFVAAFLPYLLGGTLLSGLVDRMPPRRLLVGSDLVGASLVTVAAAPVVPVGGVFAVLLALGTIAPVRSGQAAAVVAEILPGETYVAGRSVIRLGAQGAQVLGALAGGALIAPLGARGALLVDAGSFLLSASLLLGGLQRRPAPRAGSENGHAAIGVLRDSLHGISGVWADRHLRRLLLLGWTVPLVAVAPEALSPPAVAEAGRPAAAVGLWLAAVPVGMIAGDVLAVIAVAPALRQRSLWPTAAAGPVALLCFAVDPPFVVQLVLLTLSGCASAYGLALDRAVRDVAPPALLARTLVLSGTGVMVTQGLGFAAAGAVAEALPPTSTIAAAGAVGCLAVLTLARWRPRPRC